MANPYEIDLDKNAANHQPLTPLTFLERAAKVYPRPACDRPWRRRIVYRDFWRRSLQLASALRNSGIGKGDTVTVMLANTPAMLEAHFGVPMVKAVLHSPQHPARRGDHGLSARPRRVEGADRRSRVLAASTKEALALAKVKPLVIDYDDPGICGGRALSEGRAHRHGSTTRTSSRRATPTSRGRCRTTNGTRSRSTTRRARQAIRRAWSITIAARR